MQAYIQIVCCYKFAVFVFREVDALRFPIQTKVPSHARLNDPNIFDLKVRK
jgi:hypothetical protein